MENLNEENSLNEEDKEDYQSSNQEEDYGPIPEMIQESKEKSTKYKEIYKKKEIELKYLRKQLKEKQEQLFNIQKKNHEQGNFLVDTQLGAELGSLKQRLVDQEQQKRQLEEDLEQAKRQNFLTSNPQFMSSQPFQYAKRIENIIEENTLLEKYTRSEYYRTSFIEPSNAYKLLLEALRLKILQANTVKTQLDNEFNKGQEVINKIQNKINSENAMQHKLIEELEALKAAYQQQQNS